ncbi:glutamate racemase [Echinicola strongylocentroti]|uniref:Glutamate racemase n=1 Tax=Echinicola strongylocentroti TaxID=1795355 RepID=A0A2Z4IH28_9BACT|nr:glutamate racemase [Echinicola strongylocentroti]AWW29778.1 glutamate racemase [Echinicola strongylocentroti]
MQETSPIGIFDSGIGGLTVARAVKKLLPGEQMVYFGDTAHLPYGDKSTAAIQAYSVKIADVLLRANCKVILIACNSASAAAFELVKAYVASRAVVLDVIEPVVGYVDQCLAGKHVGLIGTKQTVNSGVYRHKIEALESGVTFSSLATPLLAPMIEEGFHSNRISKEIIKTYLDDEELANIDALILGCTHYPLIKPQIDELYNGEVEVIDSSEVIAKTTKEYLTSQGLLSQGQKKKDRFLVSDYTPSFESTTRLFFGREVSLEKYPLWE